MGIPTSGTLYLCNSSFMSVCRSIAHAVYGGFPPTPVILYQAGSDASVISLTNNDVRHSYFYGYCSETNPNDPNDPTNMIFIVGISIGSGVDSFGGSYSLVRNDFSDTVMQTRTISSTITLEQFSFDSVDSYSNGYYIDFSNIIAYVDNNSISRTISWSYNDGSTSGVSNETSPINSGVTVSATINSTIPF